MDDNDLVKIERITGYARETTDDTVTRELPLTIVLNNQELVTLLCSPADLKNLAVGYLSSEGLLNSRDDITKISLDESKGIVRVDIAEDKLTVGDTVFKRVLTSGCSRGTSFYSFIDMKEQVKVESQLKISAPAVFSLVGEFQRRSEMFKTTGGVHNAALCDTEDILIFSNDISRHNAIDKIFGDCILNDVSIKDRIVVTSGRISSEILIKIARRQIPFLISRSAPTNLSVRLADQVGMTLIGFVREQRMNIYTNGWRVLSANG